MTVLALDDQALAHLCIAAGAVPVRMRARWLRQIAAQLEPSQAPAQRARGRRISNGAARARLHQSRQASGLAVLRIEIDFTRTSAALLDAGLLNEAEIDDAAAVGRALQRIIALLPMRA